MRNLLLPALKKVKNKLSGKGLGKIPGAVRFYNYLYRKSCEKGIFLTNISGNKMYVDCQDKGVASEIINQGSYEEYETELFKKLIKPNMVVIDIGANIGYYALIASKLVGNQGKVYAFEPESHNFDLLNKNIDINNCKNIIPLQIALSNKSGKMKFFADKINFGAPSLSSDNLQEKGEIEEVETITLDKFWEDTAGGNKVYFVKMDAQGAEGLIVEKGRKFLEGNDLKIIIEFWPRGLKNMGTDPVELLRTFRGYGFNTNFIDDINQKVQKIEIDEIIKRCESKEEAKEYVNLLLEK